MARDGPRRACCKQALLMPRPVHSATLGGRRKGQNPALALWILPIAAASFFIRRHLLRRKAQPAAAALGVPKAPPPVQAKPKVRRDYKLGTGLSSSFQPAPVQQQPTQASGPEPQGSNIHSIAALMAGQGGGDQNMLAMLQS